MVQNFAAPRSYGMVWWSEDEHYNHDLTLSQDCADGVKRYGPLFARFVQKVSSSIRPLNQLLMFVQGIIICNGWQATTLEVTCYSTSETWPDSWFDFSLCLNDNERDDNALVDGR